MCTMVEEPNVPTRAWVIQVNVDGNLFRYYVSDPEVARISRALNRFWLFRPRWIKFVTYSGSRSWVRSDWVMGIWEVSQEIARRENVLTDSVHDAGGWDDGEG